MMKNLRVSWKFALCHPARSLWALANMATARLFNRILVHRIYWCGADKTTRWLWYDPTTPEWWGE